MTLSFNDEFAHPAIPSVRIGVAGGDIANGRVEGELPNHQGIFRRIRDGN